MIAQFGSSRPYSNGPMIRCSGARWALMLYAGAMFLACSASWATAEVRVGDCSSRRSAALADSIACMARYTDCVHRITGPCGYIQDECLGQSRAAEREYELCTGRVSTETTTVEAAPASQRCSWVPQQVVGPTNGGDCGYNDLGLPNPGYFDCGQNDQCQPVCILMGCKPD